MAQFIWPPVNASISGTGLATEATLATRASETTLAAINTKIPASPATDRATAAAPFSVRLSDGSAFIATLPVSLASQPLPTGASTEATLSAINGKFGTLGQKAMAGSAPVVIASDQSAVPASQSGTWNITNVSGTVSLPTGAATSALQTTLNTQIGIVTETAPATDTASSGLNGRLQRIAQRLTSMIAQLPAALGQGTMAQSMSVVIASNQTAVPTLESRQVNGTYAQSASLTTAVTETAPADAVGFILMADADNGADIRFCQGATASTTNGMRLQAGRDTGYIPCAANISLCSVSGTNAYQLQWVRR